MRRTLLAFILASLALPAVAASPAIQTTNSGHSQSTCTSCSVNLPASISSGDLLLIFFAHKSVTSPYATCPTNWTEFGEAIQTAGSTASLTACYKQADGGEGASATVTAATATRYSYATYRITGHENPTTQAPESTTAVVANSTAPDPPSIDPAGGSKDFLFIEAVSNSHGRIVSACSTTYATIVGAGPDNGTATNSGMGTCNRALTTAGPEDPNAMTTTGTGVEEHAMITAAIHPSGGGPSCTAGLNLTLLGVGGCP